MIVHDDDAYDIKTMKFKVLVSFLTSEHRVTVSCSSDLGCTYTLVEHICLMSKGGVLTQVLSDHLHPLHLQPLQFLNTKPVCES